MSNREVGVVGEGGCGRRWVWLVENGSSGKSKVHKIVILFLLAQVDV